jgi:hypothetical protein
MYYCLEVCDTSDYGCLSIYIYLVGKFTCVSDEFQHLAHCLSTI